jgi:hypothetical protein
MYSTCLRIPWRCAFQRNHGRRQHLKLRDDVVRDHADVETEGVRDRGHAQDIVVDVHVVVALVFLHPASGLRQTVSGSTHRQVVHPQLVQELEPYDPLHLPSEPNFPRAARHAHLVHRLHEALLEHLVHVEVQPLEAVHELDEVGADLARRDRVPLARELFAVEVVPLLLGLCGLERGQHGGDVVLAGVLLAEHLSGDSAGNHGRGGQEAHLEERSLGLNDARLELVADRAADGEGELEHDSRTVYGTPPPAPCPSYIVARADR